jgi:sodium transport system permease protein
MRPALAIVKKELRDNMRDRRSMVSALIMPLLGPLTLMVTFSMMASWQREDRPLEIPVAGMQNAPSLVAFLQRHGAIVQEAPADYEAQVRDGKLDLAIAIPEDYGKEFEAGRAAPLSVVEDSSRNKSRPQVLRARRLIEGWSRQLGALRMIARGVSPALVSPLETSDVDLATPEKTASNVLGILPMFMLIAVFVGGLYLAIDATAGERERGSLEPLLVNPVSARQVALGKWVAIVLATCVAVVVGLLGFAYALGKVPLQDLGIRFRLGSAELAGILAAALPLALFSSALQMTFALFARTYKEAQTYLSLMMLVPVLPASFLSISPLKPAVWMMAVPALGQIELMNGVMRGETPPVSWFALAAGAAMVAAALLLAWASRLLRNEKIVFGRGAGA